MNKHTQGPLRVDVYSHDTPFRVFSQQTQGNVGLFFSEADAQLFAVASDLILALQSALEHSNAAGAELSAMALQGDTSHAVRDAKGAMRELQLLNTVVREAIAKTTRLAIREKSRLC